MSGLKVEMWGFYHDKGHQIWLWRAASRETGVVAAFWFGTREHKNSGRLLELLEPLSIGNACTNGRCAYCERFSPEVQTVTKKYTQKRKRKHLSLRTWNARLVRRGLRFSKTEQTHKIAAGFTINIRLRVCLLE
jgi:IS1 family transposase